MSVTKTQALSLIKGFAAAEMQIMKCLDKNGNGKLDPEEVGKFKSVKNNSGTITVTPDTDKFRNAVKLDPKIEKFYFLGQEMNWETGNVELAPYLDLSDSDLHGIDLKGAYLGASNAVRVNFVRSNLRDANLKLATLAGAIMVKADLSGADCSSANFWGSNLTGSKADGANFQGANFTYCDMDGMKASGASFNGATFSRAIVDDSWICPK